LNNTGRQNDSKRGQCKKCANDRHCSLLLLR
jgi:hypothetical protein